MIFYIFFETFFALTFFNMSGKLFPIFNAMVKEKKENLIDLGSKVKVNLGTLCIRPCGHDIDYSLSQIAFKLHM